MLKMGLVLLKHACTHTHALHTDTHIHTHTLFYSFLLSIPLHTLSIYIPGVEI